MRGVKAVPSSHHIFSLPINSSCMPPPQKPIQKPQLGQVSTVRRRMAQEQVESQRVGPPDAQWMPIQTTDHEEGQSLGEFAVNEHNQKSDGGNLKLLGVAEARQMNLAPDAGRIYLLLLFVRGPDDENLSLLEAYVWKTAGGPRLFMSSRCCKIDLRCHIL
ncbi:hypothetical protein PVL29_009540 [Vitis rotundifolia]|uniref:Uncharacterized protein n=1 Tax=Vitis rotundifolia TaxID=103349 RepID=A0AA39DS38_VITRO|nr:hypothetical protein PVL29_009540 [Vitis rotundifolia]